VAQYHPASLEQFELGWSAIPPTHRKRWSSQGNLKWAPNDAMFSWNGWGNAVREMLSSVVFSNQPEFLHLKNAWRQYFRGLKAYALPDIVSEEPQNEMPLVDDKFLLLEAFYAMREWSAINEFAARWNSPDRENLWNEIVGFWGFGEVYQVLRLQHLSDGERTGDTL
jgi:hypothetical protein